MPNHCIQKTILREIQFIYPTLNMRIKANKLHEKKSNKKYRTDNTYNI